MHVLSLGRFLLSVHCSLSRSSSHPPGIPILILTLAVSYLLAPRLEWLVTFNMFPETCTSVHLALSSFSRAFETLELTPSLSKRSSLSFRDRRIYWRMTVAIFSKPHATDYQDPSMNVTLLYQNISPGSNFTQS